ncbi:MAG: hypothetical protein IPG50_34375 [Myxococcales bacterium]|nr:hypothetical protein [Myxococcales bacterium]
MVETPKHVSGAELVVNAFGYWPSFHDARIEGVRLDRAGGGAVMFRLHAFEMTRETDARGCFRVTKRHVVHLRFDDVADVLIPERDDTLLGLEIGSELGSDGRFLVVVESAIGNEDEGYGGSFRARSGVVLDVVPLAAE